MARMTWTKPKASTFLGPTTCELRVSGERIIIAQKTVDEKWFWYVMSNQYPGRNTSNEPCGTLDEAKAQAISWIKGIA